MAESLVRRLQHEGHIELVGDRTALVAGLDQAITDELSVEDRLNTEVRQMLTAYDKQIEQGQVDYQKMFQLVKQKLIHERGVIL